MNLPAFYERMSARERLLVVIAGGAIVALFNLMIWSWLLGALGRARAELAQHKSTRAEEAVYIKERAIWEKRDHWLHQHEPQLKNAAEASTLLDQVKQIAGKYNVLIENPAIGSGETTPYHQTVFTSIDTKSPWQPLVHFLYDAQQPEAFIVFESVNLQIDSADPTMMRGKLKIARWLAPAQRKKG
jgi:hypothetical protein